MTSRSEIARQDQASEQRRTDACATLLQHAAINDTADVPDRGRGVAVGVLSALAEAIEAEAVDVRDLRRKGWQSAAKALDETVIVVRGWRDDLIEYKPPSTQALPQPAEIAVDHRAKTPEELDARLNEAFGIPVPVRHIRTVIEVIERDTDGSPIDSATPTYGPMCGATDGSFTFPGGANCKTCQAIYAEQNAAGVADAAVLTPAWSDGPVTPQVARAMREAGPRAAGAAGVIEPPTTAPDPEYKVGDTVTVGGIEFTKIADNPFGPSVVDPFEQIRREAVEQIGETLATRVADEVAKGIDAGGAALAAFVGMPNVIEPPARRPARERMTAAQVREHGLARQRGALHRSVSQVQGHADCGTRAALSDLERPAWWNVGGKAFHACAEEINRSVAEEQADGFTGDGQGDLDTQTRLWLRHFDAQIAEQCAVTPDHPIGTWRAANKGSEHYDWWRVEGPVMVQKYVVWLTDMFAEGWRIAIAPFALATTGSPAGAPVIEYSVNLDVGLQVPNLSIIDLALSRTSSDPNSELHAYGQEVLIVDLKAGNSAPKDTFQLGVYGWCALSAGIAQHPQQIRGAYYRARRGAMTAPLPVLDLHPWPDVVQRYRDQDAMDRQGIYPANVTNFCRGCGVFDICPAQASS